MSGQVPAVVRSFGGDHFSIDPADRAIQRLITERLVCQPFTHRFAVHKELIDGEVRFEDPAALVQFARDTIACVQLELRGGSDLEPGFFAVASLKYESTLSVHGFVGLAAFEPQAAPRFSNGHISECAGFHAKLSWAEGLVAPVTMSAQPLSTAVIVEDSWSMHSWLVCRSHLKLVGIDVEHIDDFPPACATTQLLP